VVGLVRTPIFPQPSHLKGTITSKLPMKIVPGHRGLPLMYNLEDNAQEIDVTVRYTTRTGVSEFKP
jgi:hypothetical protein